MSATSLSVGVFIYNALDDALGHLVTDIFPVFQPEAKLPYISYRRASFVDTIVKSNAPHDTVNVEITIYTEDYDEGLQLAEKVRDTLDCVRGTAGDFKVDACKLVQSGETWSGDAYSQILIFEIKC